ncbi:RagB/SusD family nutrient uptake outer membrane protein [Parapedobacter tibetensis]|uniref:RagB/SusD family nutrient uptake outer membrane protein n=1 Tax=Parapedobacter tibetensis TaxID=2972951 RepID=UPI00214DD470|nr:RagB/SusD family nutrient uptake outer membrane protein [Parapedobacter tibetensis]
MKRFSLILSTMVLMASCNDRYLDLEPTTQIGESDAFWANESGLESFSNSFYNDIAREDFTRDFASDNVEHRTNPPAIRRKDYVFPTSLGSGGWSWTQLRNINYFIEKSGESTISADVKLQYLALGRFFRAWFYFRKVQQFGDVPWYSTVLNTTDDEQLYKPRDSRELVMDSVMADIQFAATHLSETKSKNRITRWTALALQSRIALYEGTWRKYHMDAGLTNAERFLELAVAASETLMQSGVYALYSTGSPNTDYFNLFQPKDTYTEEVILARSSDTQTFYYTPLFTSNGNYGATRDLVSSYLMADGRTFPVAYPNETQRQEMDYYEEFADRDPRLWQTLVYPGYVRVGTTEKTVTDFAQNATGYMIHKHVGPPIEDQGGGYRDVIIIRYAEVLLNYAEAKAELGQLDQHGLDQSINKIRERVALPPLQADVALDATQQVLYPDVADALLLEVRRERRIELAFEGFRPDDLKRWKAGHLFRKTYEGIYIPGLQEYIDLDRDGQPDLYVYLSSQSAPGNQLSGVQYFRMANVHGLSGGTEGRIRPFNQQLPAFEDWEYLNPIPTEELTLNPNLEQNEGWQP